MPKLNLDAVAAVKGSDYPPSFAAAASDRLIRDLTAAAGLTDFVATHVTIPPGGWSSQRHWHEGEDEIVVILSGTATLVDNAGEHPLHAGNVAVFRRGEADAHHLRNLGDAPCVVFAVSLPERSTVHYPDIAMRWSPEDGYTAD